MTLWLLCPQVPTIKGSNKNFCIWAMKLFIPNNPLLFQSLNIGDPLPKMSPTTILLAHIKPTLKQASFSV
eukprot:13677659-Ditylum_brightwellii.AAC.1